MIDIRVSDLVHVYPTGVRALDGVDLAVPAGSSVAVVGQNGSGKSTLVRHLNGLLRPTAGSVLVGGDDAATLTVAQLAARVGLTFQDPGQQLFAGSVLAEVAFGPRHLGHAQVDRDRAVRAALEATGLWEVRDRNPYDLGASRRKLLTLASVLAMETAVVVLDEPTTGQDALGLARVEAIVAGLAAEGRTVIAISHNLRFVAESFERVIVMREGRMTIDGSPAEVFAAGSWPTLRAADLEAPHAALVGAALGLGSTPTDAALVARLTAARRG